MDNVSTMSESYRQRAKEFPGLARAGWNKSVHVDPRLSHGRPTDPGSMPNDQDQPRSAVVHAHAETSSTSSLKSLHVGLNCPPRPAERANRTSGDTHHPVQAVRPALRVAAPGCRAASLQTARLQALDA
jgi:hypothetical protein